MFVVTTTILSLICVVRSSLILNPTGGNYTICNSKTTIVDPQRSTHDIPLLLYFPCDNTNQYPVLIFGHAAESQDTWYDYIYKGMVPQGYIVISLGSHEYVSNAKDFAKDQRYTLDWVRDKCANNATCPLYNMVMAKSIVSGMSMGGGAAMLAASTESLGENFNHTFDALMTLSGCGNVKSALKEDVVPSLIMSGSHDCICPAAQDADNYYTDIPSTTCKFLAVILNGTHCHFGDTGAAEDQACQNTESSGCHGISYKNNIPESTQHEIVIKYYSSFMYATLYQNDDSNALNVVSTQLSTDQANGVMNNIGTDCK